MDCRCELFGMEHKRQPACEVFEQLTEIVVPKKKRKKKRHKHSWNYGGITPWKRECDTCGKVETL